MWLWRWFRWFRGEVRFYAQGGLCERFLNILREQSIVLWDVEFSQDGVTATCKASMYKRLREPARRTGTRVRAVSYRSAAKQLRPFRHRAGLLVGAAVATALYMVLASRMWVVNIAVEDEEIRRQVERELAYCGIAVGRPIKDADLTAARLRTIAGVKDVHRVSVSFDGCIAYVDVQLQEEEIVLPDTSPANVVAACDGRILEMRVAAGRTIGKVGEGVVAGDLLVSGVVETKAGLLFRHASAVVLAETQHVFSASASKTETVEREGDVYEQSTVMILGVAIPLYSTVAFSDEWNVSEQERYVSLFDTRLPIGICTKRLTRMQETAVTYADETVQRLAKERAIAQADAALDDAVVTEVSYTGYWEGETYHLQAVYTCIEDIAKEVPLEIASS